MRLELCWNSSFSIFYFPSPSLQIKPTYRRDHSARTDTAAEAHPPWVVRILSPPHEILVAHEVRSFIDHEAATLHPDGVTAAEVWVKVRAVIAALIAPTLEVLVLVKDNLVEHKVINVISCDLGSARRIQLFAQHKNIIYKNLNSFVTVHI